MRKVSGFQMRLLHPKILTYPVLEKEHGWNRSERVIIGTINTNRKLTIHLLQKACRELYGIATPLKSAIVVAKNGLMVAAICMFGLWARVSMYLISTRQQQTKTYAKAAMSSPNVIQKVTKTRYVM